MGVMVELQKVLLATRSAGKIKEFKYLLGNVFDMITLIDLNDCDSVKEDGKSYYENATKKARYYFQKYKIPVLAEDSGIEIDALGGQPCIFSHRFAGPNATDQENNLKILQLLQHIEELHKRKAVYKACCVLIVNNETTYISYGECEGYIYYKEVGTNGFGYDPLFYYPPFGKTFGEITLEEKSKVSHRASAVKNLLSQLK